MNTNHTTVVTYKTTFSFSLFLHQIDYWKQKLTEGSRSRPALTKIIDRATDLRDDDHTGKILDVIAKFGILASKNPANNIPVGKQF